LAFVSLREIATVIAMKVRISKDFTFEAAHVLTQVPPDHKCARMHGHSYRITIVIGGGVDADQGWLRDHAEISVLMKPLVETLDHRFLNDIPGLENPTFELLAKWFWDRLKPSLPELCEITVHETPTVRCSYVGE
jgi:6-pyruvoyltetrahydropterin/6-carboxytetrahydropterin synthase